MHVLVTRPAPEAKETLRLLQQKGIDTTLEPLFEMRHLPFTPPEKDAFQALLFTSPRTPALYPQEAIPDLPVFCVGDATAKSARKHGFGPVHSANGSATDLVHLVRQKLLPENGPLLRLGAAMDKDALVEKLQNAGFSLASVPVYQMVPHENLSAEAQTLLHDTPPDSVLFFSPHTAGHFKHLIQNAGLAEACRSMTAWCISESTAAALKPLSFRAVHVAGKPNQNSLLDLIFRNMERL